MEAELVRILESPADTEMEFALCKGIGIGIWG